MRIKRSDLQGIERKHLGPFGGGWKWHLGIEGASKTIIVFLLFVSYRITW